MKVEIEISCDNEGTAAPYWLILDPKQNMACDIHWCAAQITGPFFSRESAQKNLEARRHHYTDRAKVFCMSGCYAYQYADAYKKAEKEESRRAI